MTVPDLPGCFSGGDTLDDALENAREAIALHVEGLLSDGEPVPPPASTVDADGGIVAVVNVDDGLLSDRAVQLCNHFSRVSFWVFFCRIIISRPSTSCLMRHSHSARHQTCCSWPHPDFCHRFVIKWPVSRIDESLVSFLTSLPLDVAERYAANARNVRCHLEGAERGEHSVPEFEFRRPI